MILNCLFAFPSIRFFFQLSIDFPHKSPYTSIIKILLKTFIEWFKMNERRHVTNDVTHITQHPTGETDQC